MAVINILSPHVADMIAAGEVVERPGSVVKELMENAVDAGAKNITVELMAGGAVFIRVTDDGCGMAPDDAGNCFLRHATSKLKDERGLEAIATMGFRGEALAAISAVSRIELRTRRAEDEAGTFVSVEGGEILQMRPDGCPRGTSFTVRDLFYNTPARLKFMKSDRAEGAYCVQLALRVALGRPDISVRCLRDGKEEFFTPGDGKPSSAVYALLGREAALSMLPAEGAFEGVRVRGFVSSPSAGRGSRAMQYFFVNGRSIKSATMQAAVEQAYKNTLLVGRFPACVLYVELPAGAVDVNVHPTKNEVKFSHERRVFDAVYHSALSAVAGETGTLEMELSAGTRRKLEPAAPSKPEPVESQAPAPGPASAPCRRSGGTLEVRSPELFFGGSRTLPVSELPKKNYPRSGSPVSESSMSAVPERRRPAYDPFRVTAPAPRRETAETPAAQVKEPEADQSSLFAADGAAEAPKARLVGEVMKTYIVAERGDAMLLIDKHAAHERMNFDRLKAEGRQIMSQTLLVPVPWRPSEEDAEILAENAPLLMDVGFELETFGEEDVIVRAVPEALDPAETAAALEEICGKLRRGSRDLVRDDILHTIACKAAIKAGWDTDPAELQVLVDKVASGEIKYCPHGRPVAIELTRKELDRQFSRIV